MNFNENYKDIKSIVQNELDTLENNMVESINVEQPLSQSIIHFLTSPSKRIRPLLGILYTKACKRKIEKEHIELFSAVELIHNASLIHDDIIDESDTRRGDFTISNKFGNKLGVLAGDYLLAIAMKKLSSINNPQIIQYFSKTLEYMTQGEINQYFEKFKIDSLENYIEKSKNKTAYLFENTLICSEILTTKTFSEQAQNFGLNFGIAFQIRDDLKNIEADDKLKPSNNDILQGIYTAPVILGGGVDNLPQGIEKTKVLINNYINKAAENIAELKDNQYTQALNKLLELFKYE